MFIGLSASRLNSMDSDKHTQNQDIELCLLQFKMMIFQIIVHSFQQWHDNKLCATKGLNESLLGRGA